MPQELSIREAVSLSSGNSGEVFEQAALAITVRSMPYMGGKNIGDQPALSVAQGLGEKLGVPLKTDNLFFAHGPEQSFQFTAKLIDAYAKLIKRFIGQEDEEDKVEEHPFEIVMLFRTPAHSPVIRQFEGLSFKCQMIGTYDSWDMWGHGLFSFDNFMESLNDIITRRPLPFEPPKIYIGFFDANPSVSAGHVRTEEETIELAEMLAELRQRNTELLNALVGEDNAKKIREMFFIVEDQTLRGLEYAGEEAFSFASLPQCAGITHTVFGVSEYGLSGMQGSVTVAPAADASLLRQLFGENQTNLSALSVFSCEFMFGINPEDREIRGKFLESRVAHYQQSAVIAYAAINGGAEDLLSPTEYEIAQQWLQNYGASSQEDARQLLKEGIPGFRALFMPEAGYYLFVDYEQLIKFHKDETNWDKTQIMEVISNLAHDETGMAIGRSIDMGLEDTDPAFRMNIDLPPDQLIDRLFRLRKLAEVAEANGPVLTIQGKGRFLAAPAQQLRLTQQ